MVRRKVAKGLSWVGKQLLSIIILAFLLILFAVPVVLFTNAGLTESWAYLAFAATLVGITGFLVAIIIWGIKKTALLNKEK